MKRARIPLLFVILGFPLGLGVFVLGYWSWTTMIEKNILLPTYGAVPTFALTAETGASFTRENLLGKVTVVDLIFTRCGGVCPLMSTKLSHIQDSLRDDPRIQFVSISVDPENDTPEALREYAHDYHAEPGRWFFLTGEKPAIYRLAREGLHLAVNIDSAEGIIHSEMFVLIDHATAIRGYYDSDDDAALHVLQRDARLLARRTGR